ncbi:MAG: J domain-containing protein [Christensenellales bacterium]|jgi:molecular chaperone DnaJ
MNPYIVLGVESSASAFEIKRAYHDAVKRCHPDKYAGTPGYASAQEEMKKVNLAYDMLASKLREGYEAPKAEKETGEEEYYDGIEYDRHALKYAYDMAMEKRLSEALLLLSKTKRRGARWHYVHAICRKKAGAFSEAIADIEIAMKLDPGNLDYRDEWRSIIGLRTRRRKRAAMVGVAATAAVAVAVAVTL